MRYLSVRPLYILCIFCMFHATNAMAGEVWVVKPKPAKSVWVVHKPSNDLKVRAKTCPCSNLCECGCNAGKECNCNQVKVAPSIESRTITSSVCVGGT